MTILDDIKAVASTAELKSLYISDVRSVATLDQEIKSADTQISDLTKTVATKRTELRTALGDILIDDVIAAVKLKLGDLTYSSLTNGQ